MVAAFGAKCRKKFSGATAELPDRLAVQGVTADQALNRCIQFGAMPGRKTERTVIARAIGDTVRFESTIVNATASLAQSEFKRTARSAQRFGMRFRELTANQGHFHHSA
jgi:hypothetical protein